MFELKQVSRKLGSLSSHPTGSPKINRVFLPEGHEYEGGTSDESTCTLIWEYDDLRQQVNAQNYHHKFQAGKLHDRLSNSEMRRGQVSDEPLDNRVRK